MEDSYNGYFLTKNDIQKSLQTIIGTPVKIEHKGMQVGKVLSGWENEGKMDILIEIDERVPEGAVISSLVSHGVCSELSLGYSVQMQASDVGEDIAKGKVISEVSLVKRGARHDCKIHSWVR